MRRHWERPIRRRLAILVDLSKLAKTLVPWVTLHTQAWMPFPMSVLQHGTKRFIHKFRLDFGWRT